ncbi:MAG TPA: FAD:protein FMN transferase [Puia sp.]|nr:FAD:protein FMN transferase [Puia sp.]
MTNLFMYFSLLSLLLLTGNPTNAQQQPQKFIFERPEMGSPFTITIEAADSMAASIAADAAFRRADTLNGILSDYIDSSEINRLSATSGQGRFVRVSDPLFDILRRSLEAARLSGGSYDVTIGPVVKLWRKARKTRTFPDPDSLRAALRKTGYRYMHLDTLHHSVWLERPGMRLDVGGLGKGFVAQAALDLLAAYGFRTAMVNAGGKIVVGLPPSGKQGWLIGINAPNEKEEILPGLLSLQQISVATSGDIYQYVELNGRRYSHIVNPKTGIGLTRRRNVTAIAANGTQADWLATACSILSLRQSLKLIRHFPGAALLITENRNGKIISRPSPKFRKYQIN